MQSYSTALKAALEKAAPDGGSYLAGQHTFHVVLMRDRDVDIALKAALEKAAPDGGSYLAGHYKFWEVQNASFRAKLVTLVDKAKQHAWLVMAVALCVMVLLPKGIVLVILLALVCYGGFQIWSRRGRSRSSVPATVS